MLASCSTPARATRRVASSCRRISMWRLLLYVHAHSMGFLLLQGTCFLVLLGSFTLLSEVTTSCIYAKAIASHVRRTPPETSVFAHLLCPKAAYLFTSTTASLSAIILKTLDFIYVLGK